jgi:type IV pilus assembly protein PilA
MFQMLKKKLKDQKGFTLIELLAVIVILGIIAAIAIPSITHIIDKSKGDAIKADAKLILNSAKLYETEKGIPTAGITKNELEPNYIDNVSTFTGTGTGTVDYTIIIGTEAPNIGKLVISGTGVKGSVKVVFTKVSLEQIDAIVAQ